MIGETPTLVTGNDTTRMAEWRENRKELGMIKEVQFGEQAFEYILSRLSYGKILSNFLSHLPLRSGRIISYLPEDVDEAKSARFEEGGIIPVVQEGTKELAAGIMSVPVRKSPVGVATYRKLKNFVVSYLRESPGRYAIFEDANLRPKDPVFQRRKTQVITLEDEVFHFGGASEANTESIDLLLSAAQSWLVIGVLVSLPHHMNFQDGQEVTSDTLNFVAESADYLVIGAYDGEGELIWARR